MTKEEIKHDKKIDKKYFNDIVGGLKRFEIRKNDCDYKVGQHVCLNCYENGVKTGEYVIILITYILKDIPQFGLDTDYCIFSFQIIDWFMTKKRED